MRTVTFCSRNISGTITTRPCPTCRSSLRSHRFYGWKYGSLIATVLSTQARQIVALMDLGEPNPYNNNIRPQTTQPYPYNDANSEYRSIINNPGSRISTQVIGVLSGVGLTQVQDYEQVYARKLNPTDYTYNAQVGFISLNQTLQPNDVLGVAIRIQLQRKNIPDGRIFTGCATRHNPGSESRRTESALSKNAESNFPENQPADLEI